MTLRNRQSKRGMVLLDRHPARPSAFADLCPHVVSKVSDLRYSVANASKDSVWVSYVPALTEALVKRANEVPAKLGLGLFIHKLDIRSIPVLSSLFRRVAFSVDGGFVSSEDLADVLAADEPRNLFIGGFANCRSQTITFWRGNLESLTIPFTAFERSGDGAVPDFGAMSVIDGGQTVRLGKYEAAVDAILYEYDPEYRRAVAKQRLQEDQTFGAALRRLRKQRGLRRADFEPDLSAKTIARIEQGKVARIQKLTMTTLAKHLGVEPEAIATF